MLLLAALWSGAACQPVIARAPFHARPDGVQWGDLRGPFDGQVVDAGSGKPVASATVVVSWAIRTGRGLSGPARAPVATVDTDADGRYRVGRFEGSLGLREALERVTVVVYKKGYLGYRSDQRFSDRSARTDFAQTQAVVRLEVLPPDVSHVRHLAWLGASGPLLSRAAWELPLAADELGPVAESLDADEAPVTAPAPVAPATQLDGRVLLSSAELKAVSGYRGAFVVEPLPDRPSSPTYDSLHFRAVGQPEKFDAAIRVWKIAGDGAESRFDELARELPSATESKEVGDRSLRSSEGALLAVAALSRAEGVVLLLTCGRGLCSDHGQVAAVARRMLARSGRLSQRTPGPVEPPPPGSVPVLPRAPVAEAAPTPGESPAPAVRGARKKRGKRRFFRPARGKRRGKAGVTAPGAGGVKKGTRGGGRVQSKGKTKKQTQRRRKR